MAVLGFSDVIDVLVVAILVYGTIVLLKKTRSVFAVLGIAILAIIYVFARILDLNLTAAIFRSFFSVFLLALVIIFQAEIRRFFELVALWGRGSVAWRKKRQTAVAKPDYIEMIAHATDRLCKQKIGMLIVITGQESVERHLQGGFELNGKISEPLLLSIFDPSTPGHDGAVIIEGATVTKFGVHLPLSKDFQQIQNYGTRHSAALGIAEVSDAMSIIVSEEKGTISVAYDGRLKRLEEISQLENEIEKFLTRKDISKPIQSWRAWLTQDFRNKALALIVAVVAWLLFAWPTR